MIEESKSIISVVALILAAISFLVSWSNSRWQRRRDWSLPFLAWADRAIGKFDAALLMADPASIRRDPAQMATLAQEIQIVLDQGRLYFENIVVAKTQRGYRPELLDHLAAGYALAVSASNGPLTVALHAEMKDHLRDFIEAVQSSIRVDDLRKSAGIRRGRAGQGIHELRQRIESHEKQTPRL